MEGQGEMLVYPGKKKKRKKQPNKTKNPGWSRNIMILKYSFVFEDLFFFIINKRKK